MATTHRLGAMLAALASVVALMLVPACAGAYFHYDEPVSWQNAEINYPGQFLHDHTTYSWGQVAPFAHMSSLGNDQDKQDATFIMRQGLTGAADTVSFQSAFTNEYLRQGDLGNSWAGLGFAPEDGTDAFKQDATFKIHSLQVGDVSGADLYRFESVSHPGEYIVGTRGTGDEGNVWLTKDDGSTQFQYDSTWERQAPAATAGGAQAPPAQQIPAGPIGAGFCTDYAWFRRPDLKGKINGDARLWADAARRVGVPVSKTPHVGDVMVFQPGVQGAFAEGHVAVVESVNGTTVHVSEQNAAGGLGVVTERDVDITDTNGIDFISRA